MSVRSTADRVALAVVGCGDVAQIHHIPNIRASSETSLVALCDESGVVLDAVGDDIGVTARYDSVTSLLSNGPPLDGVIVCTPSHRRVESVLPLLEADLNVLVEKPLAVHPETAERLTTAARRSSACSTVGYMKRHHPTVRAVPTHLDSLSEVDLVTVTDIDPDFSVVVGELHDTYRERERVDRVVRGSTRWEAITDLLDVTTNQLVQAYSFQLEHLCHDLNLLRTWFGEPNAIDHVDVFNDARYLTAHLRYPNGVRCVVESGRSDRKWFEETCHVDGTDGEVNIKFGNPFRTGTPPSVTVASGTQIYETTETQYAYVDSFAAELGHFVDCIRGDAKPITTFQEAQEDVELLASLFKTFLDRRSR